MRLIPQCYCSFSNFLIHFFFVCKLHSSEKMRRRPEISSGKPSSTSREPSSESEIDRKDVGGAKARVNSPRRSPFVFLTLFALIMYSSWSVYQHQFQNLPAPLTAEKAGKRGFSEIEALKHVQALTDLGPHSVGSDALDLAFEVHNSKHMLYCTPGVC